MLPARKPVARVLGTTGLLTSLRVAERNLQEENAAETDCRPVWKQALEGWNVEQSAQVLEWQAEAEKRGLERGKAEAKMDAP
jgi:hypothetical protein